MNRLSLPQAPAATGLLLAKANQLKQAKRFGEAVAICNQALAIDPGLTQALFLRGTVQRQMNQWQAARASFDAIVAIRPQSGAARIARCMAELPIFYMHESQIDERRAAYAAALNALAAHAGTAIAPADLAEGIGAFQPFFLPYQERNDRDLQALYGELLCRLAAAKYGRAGERPLAQRGEPLRVGLVSGYFRMHSNWKQPISGWLDQLDRRRFQLFGYHTGTRTDATTATAARQCTRFVQGPLPVERWRQEILADSPHILIYPEIGMDPVVPVLAAQRLAAVQCSFWGHPETSGMPTVDYFLTGALMEPDDGDEHYTEALIRLPNLSIYYEPLPKPAIAAERGQYGMRRSATVYWCCQSMFKYLPQYDEVLVRIAKAAGDVQFVFLSDSGRPHVSALFPIRLQQAFARAGLSAGDHTIHLPGLKMEAFSAVGSLCDVFLDSLGWSGGNTTLESLVHDLPIVTLPGRLMRGRHSAGILKMMGIEDTIAPDIDGYVALAVRMARDPAWRAEMRAKIAARKHRVYRDRVSIAGLERFLEQVGRAP